MYVLLLVTDNLALKRQVEESLFMLSDPYHLYHFSSLGQTAHHIQNPSPTAFLVDWGATTEEEIKRFRIERFLPLPSIILLTDNDPGWDLPALTALGVHDYLPVADISPGMLARVLRYAQRYQLRENQIQRLADAIPVSLMITSQADGEILFVNEKQCQTYGVAPEALLGRSVMEYYDDLEDRSTLLAQLVKEGSIQGLEVKGKPMPDGQPSVTAVWVSPIIFRNQDALISVTLDVTERRQAEEQRRASEERYRQTLDNMLEGCQIIGFDWRYLYLNDAAAQYGRQPKEALLGHTVMEKYPGIENTEMFALLRQCMDERVARVADFEFSYPDGDRSWFQFSVQPEPEGIFILTLDITEQKRAQEQLLYQANLLEHVSDAIIATDLDFNIISWNRAAAALYGWSTADVVGQSIEIIKTRYPDDTIRDEVYQQFAEEGFGQGEVIQETRDGTAIYVLSSVAMVRNAEGIPIGVIAVNRDITGRKQVEQALLDSEARLNGIIESAMDAIISVDEAQHIVVFNVAAEQMFGCEATEAIGQPLDRFIPARFREAHRQHIRNFGETGVTNRAMGALGTIAGRRVGGEGFPIEASISQIEAGGARLFTVILRDITERKKIEEALAMSERKFRSLFENAPVGMYRIKINGSVVLEANSSFSEILEIPREDILAKPGYIHLADSVEWSLIVDQLLNQGQVVDREMRIKTRSGVKTCLISATLHPQEDVLEGTLLDITQRKQAEAEIRDLNRNLERRVRERTVQWEVANKELEAFAYSVSHDLRAPLRAMSGFSKILMQEYSPALDESGQRYLRRINENAGRMGALIDDLLKFSRLIREPVRREMVDVTAVAHRVLSHLNFESVTSKLDIVVDDLPPCQADPQLLYQVYFNLIENAVKYSRPREVIRIHIGVQAPVDTAASPGQVIYFVQDNGVGFDMEYADKIFGVFQRLHLAEEYEGTGVGLALVQRIIHRHRGQIWVEAVIDQGATFYFTIGSAPEESAD